MQKIICFYVSDNEFAGDKKRWECAPNPLNESNRGEGRELREGEGREGNRREMEYNGVPRF